MAQSSQDISGDGSTVAALGFVAITVVGLAGVSMAVYQFLSLLM